MDRAGHICSVQGGPGLNPPVWKQIITFFRLLVASPFLVLFLFLTPVSCACCWLAERLSGTRLGDERWGKCVVREAGGTWEYTVAEAALSITLVGSPSYTVYGKYRELVARGVAEPEAVFRVLDEAGALDLEKLQ